MKLALIGYPVEHSLSPSIYRRLLPAELERYDLLSYPFPSQIPSAGDLAKTYDGVNVTSPYKTHFLPQVEVPSPLVRRIGAINTLSLHGKVYRGTNTDLLAVDEILRRYRQEFGALHLIILGSGVMAKVTKLVADDLGLESTTLSRRAGLDLAGVDLRSYRKESAQNMVVNCCSRTFTFNGNISTQDIFWDHNYAFEPHQSTLPSRVKAYQDGRELLELQARHAVKFWAANKG